MLAENGPKILEKSNAEAIFRIFRGCRLASLAGFEPTAFRLGGECSILLSYRDIYLKTLIFQGFSAFRVRTGVLFELCLD